MTPSRAKKGESRLDRSRSLIALYARAFGSIPSYGDSNPGTRRKANGGRGWYPPAQLEAVGVTSGVERQERRVRPAAPFFQRARSGRALRRRGPLSRPG
jgi:hypothetical protein